MSNTQPLKRLSQIGNQRSTDGPHNVFDASQFKLLVEQDVPSNVIEKLQKDFGNNMAAGEYTTSNLSFRMNVRLINLIESHW